jgi:hypothetical protein
MLQNAVWNASSGNARRSGEQRPQSLQDCQGREKGDAGYGFDCVSRVQYHGDHVLYDREEMFETATIIPGPETDLFAEACIEANTRGLFSLTVEQHEDHPNKNPYNTLVLINDQGEIIKNIASCCLGHPLKDAHPATWGSWSATDQRV